MSRCMPKLFAAVEFERLVGFEEVVVAADLHGPIAGVDDLQRRLAAGRH